MRTSSLESLLPFLIDPVPFIHSFTRISPPNPSLRPSTRSNLALSPFSSTLPKDRKPVRSPLSHPGAGPVKEARLDHPTTPSLDPYPLPLCLPPIPIPTTTTTPTPIPIPSPHPKLATPIPPAQIPSFPSPSRNRRCWGFR